MLTALSDWTGNHDIRHISDVSEIIAGNVLVSVNFDVPLLDHGHAVNG